MTPAERKLLREWVRAHPEQTKGVLRKLEKRSTLRINIAPMGRRRRLQVVTSEDLEIAKAQLTLLGEL